MRSYVFKRLTVLGMLVVFMLAGLGLSGQVLAGVAAAPKTLDRNLEAVVVEGAAVSSLSGAPLAQLFIYSYTGSALAGQIPLQIDEVTAGGAYTTTEDGLLDANDQLVFMAADLGDQRPATPTLTATLPISDTWFEIEVTDPTSGKQGWAYLVRSTILTPNVSANYVDYITATRRITASQYVLGFSISHPGFNELSLNQSGLDILDRAKLRAVLDNVPFLGSVSLTEDDLPAPATVPLKDGPVRVILQQAAAANVLGNQASFEVTYLAYASMFQATSRTSFTLSGGITISSVRTSLDLNSAATGATFYNAHTPAGVPIDGVPDAVTTTLSTWSQVSTTTGRMIQVNDLTAASGTQQTYYKDDSSTDPTDTGDQRSFGDAGLLFSGSISSPFTVRNSTFILPAAAGENVGDAHQNFVNNPLQVVLRASDQQAIDLNIYLPLILK